MQLNGEAYFKVAPDEKHAFIVQVGDLEVKVLGTSFNVSAGKDAKDIYGCFVGRKARDLHSGKLLRMM